MPASHYHEFHRDHHVIFLLTHTVWVIVHAPKHQLTHQVWVLVHVPKHQPSHTVWVQECSTACQDQGYELGVCALGHVIGESHDQMGLECNAGSDWCDCVMMWE